MQTFILIYYLQLTSSSLLHKHPQLILSPYTGNLLKLRLGFAPLIVPPLKKLPFPSTAHHHQQKDPKQGELSRPLRRHLTGPHHHPLDTVRLTGRPPKPSHSLISHPFHPCFQVWLTGCMSLQSSFPILFIQEFTFPGMFPPSVRVSSHDELIGL